MTGRSAGMGLRRLQPSRRRCCAVATVALFASCLAFCWTISAPAAGEPLLMQSAVPTDSEERISASEVERSDEKPGPALPEPDADTAAAESMSENQSDSPPLPLGEGRGEGNLDATGPSPNPLPKGERMDLAEALARHGDLTLRNSTLDGALFTIGELWGINIVVGEVHGTVNGVFKDAPLREILDSILLSNGYSYRPVGKSLVVSPLSELGQINPFYVSATIPVGSADVDEVVEGARLLSTPQGQVRAIKSARSLFVLDFPDRVQMIREFVASIDGASRRGLAGGAGGGAEPLEVGYFHTQYIEAKTAKEALLPVLSKDGKVGVLEKEDRLVVTDYAENLKMVEQVLQRLDRPRPQVRITALIYDISLQDIEELGINWGNADGATIFGNTVQDPNGTRRRTTALSVDSVMKVPFDANETGSALTFMSLSPHVDIRAVVLALQNANDSRLLADPHVAVLDNEEAEFRSVSEIPYQQLTQTGGGPPIGTTAFKEAGITLRVRPKIAAEGTIKMVVSPQYSRLTGFTPGDNQPIIDTRDATTTLTIANRQVVVIGGLRQRSDVGDFKAVPYLSDIKWVGKLFRSRETNVRESELVVFIMPEIIGYADQPNDRQQLVVDTIDHRLNQIPEAEGRPSSCPRSPGCATGTPAPLPDDSLLPIPGPAVPPSDVPPAGPPAAPSAERPALPDVRFGVAAQGQLRRLPAVDGPPLVVASRPTELFGSPLPPGEGWGEGTMLEDRAPSPYALPKGEGFQTGPPAPASPLRPDYDARFRATGGVYRSEQRLTERGLLAEPQPVDKGESFWQRFW